MHPNKTTQSKSKLKKFIKKYNNSRGWLLIAMVFFFFVLTTAAIIVPVSQTAYQLSNTLFEENIRRSEQILLTTNSPIRNYVVDELYKRIQQQLIEHIAKSGGSTNYICQGVEVPTSSTDPEGSKLENQFGLCQPEKLFEGMDGNTNQTIDFNKAFDLKLDPSIENEDSKLAIEKIMRQNENSYDYTLRTMFVRQEVIEYKGVGKPRTERYHWLTRADVIATTNGFNLGKIHQPLVIYYDVYLLNEFYPNQFYGAGSACNRKDPIAIPCPLRDLFEPGQLIGPLDCFPVTVINADGSAISCNDDIIACGDIKPTGGCIVSSGPTFEKSECPLSGGRTLNIFKVGVRAIRGCASLNSGRTKTGPDPKGYSFVLTVRTVSIGSSYN